MNIKKPLSVENGFDKYMAFFYVYGRNSTERPIAATIL